MADTKQYSVALKLLFVKAIAQSSSGKSCVDSMLQMVIHDPLVRQASLVVKHQVGERLVDAAFSALEYHLMLPRLPVLTAGFDPLPRWGS